MSKKDGLIDKSDKTLLEYSQKLEQKIHNDEQKRQDSAGEKWFHTGGIIYKLSRVLYIIVALYSLFFDLVFCMGWSFDLIGNSVYSDSREKLLIMGIITAALITALVFVCLKKPKITACGCITVPAASASAIVTWQWYTASNGTTDIVKNIDNGVYSKYWICNFPVLLLIIFSVLMTIIVIRDRRSEDKIYSSVIRSLYGKKISELREQNDGDDPGMLTNEQWIEALREYTDETKPSKQKRSVKARELKEKIRNKTEGQTEPDGSDE
ncbi:MAG: hypothetical protein ACI4QV_00850 [Acutalibacteraceae bacterium]